MKQLVPRSLHSGRRPRARRLLSPGENAAVPAAEAKLLDASTLQPGESLAGRDLQGWTLRGDFSGRVFDGANLRRATATLLQPQVAP